MPQDHHAQTEIGQIGRMLDDGLILVDLDGVILSANSPAVRWFGENLMGRLIADVITHPDIHVLFDKAAGGDKGGELRFEPTHIVQREFRVRLQRIGDDKVAFLLLDMTLQRNLEKVRRDFVANVSHELRSPLTSLAGFVETMLSGDVPDPEMQKRFLGIMDEEAKRMSRLIDDLLSLSRVEVDEHIVPDKRVNLGELLHSVRDSLAGRALKKKMQIKIQSAKAEAPSASPPPKPVILGNHDEITEVFINLLENAIKYGFDGSDITLTIEMLSAHLVRVDVVNFGEGIQERHLPRLTERFYRVDKARSRQIGGTGLGLAIVKHIINRHRGSLSIASTLGETTRFTVDFPLANDAGE